MNILPSSNAVVDGVKRIGLVGKCVGILFLILVLQIPLLMINGLSSEREGLRNTAVREIGERWGGAQQVSGPILVVPYAYTIESWQEKMLEGTRTRVKTSTTHRAQAYFLPEQFTAISKLVPEQRSRGIYNAIVYCNELHLQGSFAKPDFRSLGIVPSEVFWNESRVLVALGDVRGVREAPDWTWQGHSQKWQPGTRWGELSVGLHSLIGGLGGTEESFAFDMRLSLNGSGDFSMVPVGRSCEISMDSTWADPGFTGAYLPIERSVTPQGFKARWNVTYLGRVLPQQWSDRDGEISAKTADFRNAAVGVSLAHSVDAYRTMDRALKHGILFVALVFSAFFMFEMLAVPGLSVLHYSLVGAALCLFYLALLALSEFTGFTVAYLIAMGAATLLISLYSVAILKSGLRALIMSGGLLLVYGYLYFVLQMQDYALLAGTAALFAALAGIMWVTRKPLTASPVPAGPTPGAEGAALQP
jgi:inner membrane protein